MTYPTFKYIFACALVLACTTACLRERPEWVSGTRGYRPVYSSSAASDQVTFVAARDVTHAGSSFVKGNYIFKIEEGSGIHIIDATNPNLPLSVGFLQIDGCISATIAGNELHTNNMGDLITVDITDYQHPVVTNRVPKGFNTSGDFDQLPPERGYFECIDHQKGKVTGWFRDTLIQPKCYY